jgi:hypothetical protein
MNIGTKIYGFCNGYFGRDDYTDKIIIAEGKNWIVCAYLDDSDNVTFVSFNNEKEKQECINKWMQNEYDED